MKKEDLTQVKNIGPSRMKLLNESGITTIKQLDETPLEKLTQIESIGRHYAKLIKDSVAEYYGKNQPQQPRPAKKRKLWTSTGICINELNFLISV